MLFGHKKKAKFENIDTSYLFKELPFYKAEPFIMLIITGAVLILALFDLVGLYKGGLLISILLVLGATWAIFLIKQFVYLPRGNKHLVMRFYKSALAKLSCEKPNPDALIHFSNDDEVPPAQITRINKVTEACTGKPLLLVAEGYPENFSVMELLGEKFHDRSAEEVNTAVKLAFANGWKACLNNMLRFGSRFKDPTFLLLIGVLIVVIIAVVLNWTTLSTLQDALKAGATATTALAPK